MLDLIYCADGNPRLLQIAQEEGWLLGFRSDKWMGQFPVSFIDVDYRHPDFERHLDIVAQWRPRYATVPDLSEDGINCADIDRAVRQAERLSPHCETVLIVPKLSGHIALLPDSLAIGYSIPSSYGGAAYPLWELLGRRVHLLGGSPRKQWNTYLHLNAIATVMSADGNYGQKMAVRYAEYWQKGKWIEHPQVLSNGKDLYLECWRWSCRNIRQRWEQLVYAD